MTKLISLENICKNDNHSGFILRSQNSNKHLMYGLPYWFLGLITGKFTVTGSALSTGASRQGGNEWKETQGLI